MKLIRQDLANHFAVMVMSATLVLPWGWKWALVAGLVAAFLREVYNKHQGGQFSKQDFLWGCLGLACVLRAAQVGLVG